MRNIIVLLFLTISTFACCQQKENKNLYKITMIKEVLVNQIKHGISGEIFETDISTYTYSEKDLEVTINILQDELIRNGFRSISNQSFNEQIQKVFKRVLSDDVSLKYVYLNFNDKCARSLKFYRNDNTVDLTPFSLYVVKNKNFVTNLFAIPEIVDYSREFPEILKIENEVSTLPYQDNEKIKVIKWKDISDLSERRQNNLQTLVNRNKYLFNDNKASLAWLKVNDTYFLESLVKTFGYTEDKDLLNWVMERNKEESDARDFINNYLFVRNCKGELEIRDGILKYIAENTSDDEGNQTFANALSNYSIYDSPNNWTEQERYKIIAYQANTYDYLFEKSNILGNTNRGRISVLGAIFYNSFVNDDEQRWKELEQNFKDNNYYNLPHLKNLVSEVLKFEPGYF